MAFWAGLHDLGKASPAFQRKYAPAIPELEGSGLDFPVQLTAHGAPHGLVSTFTLSELLQVEAGMDRMTAKHVAQALGGHHGAWPTAVELQRQNRKTSDLGDEAWETARGELFKALQQVINAPELEMPELSMEAENAWLTTLSGIVTVADWLGSMEDFFIFQEEHLDLSEYTAAARPQAERALQEQGWLHWKPSDEAFSFRDLFTFQPREMQRLVFERTQGLRPPALLIVETPTGGGITEAALAAADALLSATAGRGLYIAMPTMATSNQMYDRFKAFLNKRYPGQNLDPLLLHSQSQ